MLDQTTNKRFGKFKRVAMNDTAAANSHILRDSPKDTRDEFLLNNENIERPVLI